MAPVASCRACIRRAWLLQQLSARLAYRAREPERLLEALALSDEQLVRALGGRRKQELLAQHARFADIQPPPAGEVQRICHHDPLYPDALRGERAPAMLHVAGGMRRMRTLLAQPTVAIVGACRASDYGMEVAYSLARELAASGVTVVAGFAEGIAAAAHQGALDADAHNYAPASDADAHGCEAASDAGAYSRERAPGAGAAANTVTVMAGGVNHASPASWRALHRRIVARGCALAELPCGSPVRVWCYAARTRIVVALAQLVIVVEAHDRPAELLPARLAATAGRIVAAVPGRVCAPAAAGPHRLLREHALLVRNGGDALNALHGVDAPDGVGEQPSTLVPAAPSGRLRSVWEEVGTGNDTVEKLAASDCLERGDPRALLVALARLECCGAVVRGDGGRYVACM